MCLSWDTNAGGYRGRLLTCERRVVWHAFAFIMVWSFVSLKTKDDSGLSVTGMVYALTFSPLQPDYHPRMTS